MNRSKHVMKWVIWTLAGILYLYEYFIRVAPSVMVPELMQAFSVNATAIGALSGFYFYIYGPMQIPVGVLIDRYGARKLLTFSGVAAGLGTLLFGLSAHYLEAALGRFLMGAGSAFGFVGMVYICSHFFTPQKRGIMIGFANTIGMLGAILGQGPLSLALNTLGWRGTFIILAIFGIFVGGLLYFLVRDQPPHQEQKMQRGSLKINLLQVCKNPQSWISALCALFFYVATATFAGLWGIPFIESTYKISTQEAGFAVSMVFFGWAVGGPIIGIYSDKIKEKKSIIAYTTLIGFLIMCAIIYTLMPVSVLFALMFSLGFFSSAQLLNFSYSIDTSPQFAKATATAFVNFVVVMGTAALQPLVGFFLDLNWTGQMQGGIRVYTPESYKLAMTIFPACFLIAFLFTLFMKKKPTS